MHEVDDVRSEAKKSPLTFSTHQILMIVIKSGNKGTNYRNEIIWIYMIGFCFVLKVYGLYFDKKTTFQSILFIYLLQINRSIVNNCINSITYIALNQHLVQYAKWLFSSLQVLKASNTFPLNHFVLIQFQDPSTMISKSKKEQLI